MKKILALVMVLTMVCSLSGCGIVDKLINSYIRGEQYEDNAIENEINPLIDETEAPTEEEKPFSVGSTTGITYESEFLSIGCSLPDGWTFYTDEEIKELNNMSSDLAGEEYEKLMEESTLVYDMMAVSDDQISSINIILEKSNAAAVALFDLSENVDTIAQTAKPSLENIGFTDVNFSIATTQFLGNQEDCLKWDMKMGTEDYYEMQIFVKAFGYLATITVASDDLSVCEDIIASFYEL